MLQPASGRAAGARSSAPHVLPAVGDGAFAIERLLVERTLSVNTAAAGGNASLMTIG